MNYKIIKNVAELKTATNLIKKESVLVIDTETDSLDYFSQLLGVAIYLPQSDISFFLPTNSYFKEGLFVEDIIASLKGDYKIINHNFKYDYKVLKRHGLELSHERFLGDTLVMAHLINPSKFYSKNLEDLVKKTFKIKKKPFTDIVNELGIYKIKANQKGLKWDNIDWGKDADILLPHLGKYACEDVFYTHKLYNAFLPKLSAKDIEITSKIEYPLLFCIGDMESRGHYIDSPKLMALKKKSDELLSLYEGEFIAMNNGKKINVKSAPQLRVLMEDRGYKPVNYTDKGQVSWGKEEVGYYAKKGDVFCILLEKILKIRTLQSNYLYKIPLIKDNRNTLRGNFNQLGTETGRFSSSLPNLQAIDSGRGEIAKMLPIREIFIPREGYVYLAGDYSQIEPRMLAHISNDQKLISFYNEGKDIYLGLVDSIKNTGITITRDAAKVVILAVMYELGSKSLAAGLGVNEKVAKKIIDGFYSEYSGVANWKSKAKAIAKRDGYVKTIFGNRRLLDFPHDNNWLYAANERKICNTIVQGSAAMYFKYHMVKIAEFIKPYGNKLSMLLTVHDELCFEAHKSLDIPEVVKGIKKVMEETLPLRVPVKFDLKVCHNWAEGKSINRIDEYNNKNKEWITSIL